jgi:hypothetical protein|tara:strand:+ start:648 stop:839 length:192 start_codon:yes stop_codon:yes gene_type:complete
MANNNNSKKNDDKNRLSHEQEEPYDSQIAKGFRKEKKRSKRHRDKHILKDFPEVADEYFNDQY